MMVFHLAEMENIIFDPTHPEGFVNLATRHKLKVAPTRRPPDWTGHFRKLDSSPTYSVFKGISKNLCLLRTSYSNGPRVYTTATGHTKLNFHYDRHEIIALQTAKMSNTLKSFLSMIEIGDSMPRRGPKRKAKEGIEYKE